MKQMVKSLLLLTVASVAQAGTYQELVQYVRATYGEESEIYWRTMLISNQFAKEAELRLPEIAYALYESKPDTVINFSNVDCAVEKGNGDYMPFCTYVFTRYQREYDDKGHVTGAENKQTYCAVPMSIDFKFAVNYTYEKVYVPAIKAGQEPNLLNYPPAGDPTKNAITYLQECLAKDID
jgi:hypothetical protein